MKYLDGVLDKGIIISPSKKGEKLYDKDGGGIREAVIKKEKDTFYLSYDGATPGKTNKSYWKVCLAKSKDLINWKKLGVKLPPAITVHSDAKEKGYMDVCGTDSPWSIYDSGKWYHFYLGVGNCNFEGVPTFPYTTMLATSKSLKGKWKKRSEEKGHEADLCFNMGDSGAWDDCTASSGEVIINPKYGKEKGAKKYLMFYSGSCMGVTKRSIGIARTDDLSVSGNIKNGNGTFWEKDPDPILPVSEDIENSSIYFEEQTGTYYLFTNRIKDNYYTDAVVVYWTKDIDKWSKENSAVVIDNTVSTWAKGAIGMPTVIKKDESTLALVYDGVDGDGIGHLDRKIGLAEISLPLKIKE